VEKRSLKIENIPEFYPLKISSKFTICGLPLYVDTYKTCSFGCIYCYVNYRTLMASKKFQIANLKWMQNKLNSIYNKGIIKENNFLDYLLRDRITWHWGAMSDPFQPIEGKLHITEKMVDIANEYDISILFSTKSDSFYGCHLNPNLHSFQLSITNIENNRILEPNVPDINNRIKFFRKLKNRGFKVGVRLHPFIPGVAKINIIDAFAEADYFCFEGLKLISENEQGKEYLLRKLNLKRSDFVGMGLLNLRPEIRMTLYKEFVEKLEDLNIPYSLADNDLHYISKSKCCCGEPLVKKSTDFNNTALFFRNKNYGLEDIEFWLKDYRNCEAFRLYSSNTQKDCKTCWDFFKRGFYDKRVVFSRKFMQGFNQEGKLKLPNIQLELIQ